MRYMALEDACRGLPKYKVQNVLNSFTPGEDWRGAWSKGDTLREFAKRCFNMKSFTGKTFVRVVKALEIETKQHKKYQKEKKECAAKCNIDAHKNLTAACQGSSVASLKEQRRARGKELSELERRRHTLRNEIRDIEAIQLFLLNGKLDVDFPHSNHFRQVIKEST